MRQAVPHAAATRGIMSGSTAIGMVGGPLHMKDVQIDGPDMGQTPDEHRAVIELMKSDAWERRLERAREARAEVLAARAANEARPRMRRVEEPSARDLARTRLVPKMDIARPPEPLTLVAPVAIESVPTPVAATALPKHRGPRSVAGFAGGLVLGVLIVAIPLGLRSDLGSAATSWLTSPGTDTLAAPPGVIDTPPPIGVQPAEPAAAVAALPATVMAPAPTPFAPVTPSPQQDGTPAAVLQATPPAIFEAVAGLADPAPGQSLPALPQTNARLVSALAVAATAPDATAEGLPVIVVGLPMRPEAMTEAPQAIDRSNAVDAAAPPASLPAPGAVQIALAPSTDGPDRPIAAPGLPPQPEIERHPVVVFAPATLADDRVVLVAGALDAAGFDSDEARRVPFTVKTSHVRYYHAADAELAADVARAITGQARDFTSGADRPPPGTIEVWLEGRAPQSVAAAKPKAPARARTAQQRQPAPVVVQEDPQVAALRAKIIAQLRQGN